MPSLFMLRPDDQHYALTVLQLLTRAQTPQPSFYFVHDGEPIPKARARFSKNGGPTYTPPRTVKAEKDLAWVLKSHVTPRPLVGPLALVAIFYRSDQRVLDADNLLKLLKDSGNRAGIWHDDSQIVACAALLDLDANHPRTVVAIAPAMSGLKRMPPKPETKGSVTR